MTTWTPSLSRTVPVPVYGAPVRGLVATTPPPLMWPSKAPVALLDYTLDLTRYLEDENDALASIDVTSSPSAATNDMAVIWAQPIGGGVTFGTSGGVGGTPYSITVEISTELGRVDVFQGVLICNTTSADSPPVVGQLPPTVIIDAAGNYVLIDLLTPLSLSA